jgi:hypothetical protein
MYCCDCTMQNCMHTKTSKRETAVIRASLHFRFRIKYGLQNPFALSHKTKKKNPANHYSKGKAIPLQAFSGPDGSWRFRLPDRHMNVVRLSVLRTGRLYPQEIFLVLISVRGWVDAIHYSNHTKCLYALEVILKCIWSTLSFLLHINCLFSDLGH